MVGVEGDAALVAKARANAVRNGIGNAEFAVENLFEPESFGAWASARYDLVLLDPPRAGAAELLTIHGTLASAASRVYFLPSGQFGARCRNPGARPRVHADRCRGDGHVSAYHARRIDRGIRGQPMSLGPLMVDIAGTELTPEDIRVLSHPLVGSVILFSRNYRDMAQVTALTAAIRALRTPHLLIAVDHEGGRVQRFREGFTRLPSARLLGRRYDEDRREGLGLAQSVGWLMASELRAVGVDFSFAPCVDLDYGVSEIIGDRAFHSDPDAVAALGVAYMAGMREAGMAAVAKHFPGHGAVIADSHVALPVDRRKFVDLEPDIRPYRPLIDNNLAGVMGAHVVFPAVDAAAGQPVEALDHRGAARRAGFPWLRVRGRSDDGRSGCFWGSH